MLKRSMLLFVLMLAVLVSAGPALAYQAPVLLYVDTAYTGTESGTEAQPYNTIAEAVSVAQNSAGGGVIMLKTNGVYVYNRFVDKVTPGQTGLPIAGLVLYALLAIFSLTLILVGWQFGRRSRQLQH